MKGFPTLRAALPARLLVGFPEKGLLGILTKLPWLGETGKITIPFD